MPAHDWLNLGSDLYWLTWAVCLFLWKLLAIPYVLVMNLNAPGRFVA